MITHEDFLRDALGFAMEARPADPEARKLRREQVNLELLVHGLSPATSSQNGHGPRKLVDSFRERMRLLGKHLCPADQRINQFLQTHFADLNLPAPLTVPTHTLVLDRH